MGFAPAQLLHALSFADVLDEDAGRGYQRRFNSQHSLDFRRYIHRVGSTTIPLTFNLRPRDDAAWTLTDGTGRNVRLDVTPDAGKVLAQVDCQHRIGHLGDSPVELPFMCFIGLSEREEMEVFNVINSKARGLNASLLDFHEAQLAGDVAIDRPELFIALCLRNDPASPWFRQLDLGGNPTSGMVRRASLRTMQKAIKVFLTRTKPGKEQPPEAVARLVLEYWAAVAMVLPEAWAKPRKHLLCKGIGVYAMMEVAGDICLEAQPGQAIDRAYFAMALSDFAEAFDWTTEGPLQGLGGEGGVKSAVTLLREARRRSRFKLVHHG